jgi:hypothetical protein
VNKHCTSTTRVTMQTLDVFWQFFYAGSVFVDGLCWLTFSSQICFIFYSLYSLEIKERNCRHFLKCGRKTWWKFCRNYYSHINWQFLIPFTRDSQQCVNDMNLQDQYQFQHNYLYWTKICLKEQDVSTWNRSSSGELQATLSERCG